MRIFGIDPGLAHLGYGIVDTENGRLVFVAAGEVVTPSGEALGARLMTIHEQISELLTRHQPDVVAIERQIYCQNVQTAMTLGQVEGIITLTAEEHDLEIWTGSPRELKMSLVGRGQATKPQVAKTVLRLLNLNGDVKVSDHATDALAAAIAYSNRTRLDRRIPPSNDLVARRRR